MKNLLVTGILLLLTNCIMKPKEQNVDRSQFQELQNNKGSSNYEVIELADKKFETEYIYLDSEKSRLIVSYFNNPIKISDFETFAQKLDISGNRIDTTSETNRIFENGTDWHGETYTNWPVSDDKTEHPFLDPFSGQEINDPFFQAKEKENPAKWFEEFKRLYNKASYVYLWYSEYYFKVNSKWYLMNIKDMSDAIKIDIKKQYPKKQEQPPRMLELENLAPIWYHKSSEKRDTSLIKLIDYDSTFYTEEEFGLVKRGYSAGWWYLEVYMPLGDTLRIKRYSDFEDPDLKLYKIPAAYGGRNDVLFIVQNPNKIHIEQVGGMYAIRPRDAEQPERRYKRISYGDTSKGQPHILSAEESEEYKNWKIKTKG